MNLHECFLFLFNCGGLLFAVAVLWAYFTYGLVKFCFVFFNLAFLALLYCVLLMDQFNFYFILVE